MRDIKDLLDTVDRYKNVRIQKRFDSKKNTVVYALINNQPRILKWYVPGLKQNMDIEFTVLKKGFSTLAIPSPFEKDTENNVLVMSYILGENVCDIINNPHLSLDEKKKAVFLLADWFVRFHTFFKTDEYFRIRGDATLRNFLLTRGKIWGVDFEESRPGKPNEDLATLCASILSTEPMFTNEKFQLCLTFLHAYRDAVNWRIEGMNAEISYALLERIQWRPTHEESLRKYASKIRQKGLQGTRQDL